MCISIVVGVKVQNRETESFARRISELGALYNYGIGMGKEQLLPEAKEQVINTLGNPQIVFEVHDPSEVHCACDIDQDIRNGSKLEQKSRFFDFIKETLEYRNLRSMSVLFFQEELPNESNVRKQLGTYEEFVELLNRWNTWQVQGFEPTRRAYFIADDSPLLFTFRDRQLSQ